MARYIKFRLSAAKMSVSMAFLALLGGLTARAGFARAPSETHSTTARTDKWLPKLNLNGLSPALQGDLTGLERAIGTVYAKDRGSLSQLTAKIEKVYTKQQANATFLSIEKANKDFYVKGESVANSNELGGLPADRFIQGNGNVATGALSGLHAGSARQTLVTVPGTNGEIIVVCQPAPAGGSAIQVLIHNATSQAIPAVQDLGEAGGSKPITIAAKGDTPLTTIGTVSSQLHLQTFPTAGLNQVLTLTISGEPGPNGVSVVGQLLNGGG